MEKEVWIIYVPEHYDDIPKFIGVVIGNGAESQAEKMAENYSTKHGVAVSYSILEGPVINLEK